MRAEIVQRVDKALHVVLFEEDEDDEGATSEPSTSINARLVEAGLAVVEKRRERFLQPLVRGITDGLMSGCPIGSPCP